MLDRATDKMLGLRWLVMVVLFAVGMRGVIARVRVQFGDVGGSLLDDRATNVIFYAVYAIALVVGVATIRREPTRLGRFDCSLVVFHVVLVVSTLWSIEWGRTLNQSLQFAIGTAAVAVLARSATTRQIVAAVLAATHGVLVLSVVAVAGDWEFAIDRRGYWAGMLFNRNALGLVAAVALVSSIGWAWLNRNRRGVVVLSSLGGLFALVMWAKTASATPMIAAIASCGAGAAMMLIRKSDHPRRALALGGVALGVLVAAAVAWRGQVSEWIGRDATFTGRTSTWGLVVDWWLERPVAGFGYFAGWFDSDLREGLREIGFNHWEAHNGYLEVLLGAGIIGAVVLLWLLLAVLVLLWRSRGSDEAPWFAAVLGFFLVVNVGETAIAANRLAWMLLVAVAVRMASLSPTDSTD